jgi:hypothetical protein
MVVEKSVKIVLDDLTMRLDKLKSEAGSIENTINSLKALYSISSTLPEAIKSSHIHYKSEIYKLLMENSPGGCTLTFLANNISAGRVTATSSVYQYISKQMPIYRKLDEVMQVRKHWIILPKGKETYKGIDGTTPDLFQEQGLQQTDESTTSE